MGPEMGYGMGYGMQGRGILPMPGMMDDGFGYYGHGARGLHHPHRGYGYHRRNCPCAECIYEDYI
jgi:hypothetical protein